MTSRRRRRFLPGGIIFAWVITRIGDLRVWIKLPRCEFPSPRDLSENADSPITERFDSVSEGRLLVPLQLDRSALLLVLVDADNPVWSSSTKVVSSSLLYKTLYTDNKILERKAYICNLKVNLSWSLTRAKLCQLIGSLSAFLP